MARTFVAASSQSLSRSGVPLTARPLTIACWVKPATIVANSCMVAIENNATQQGWYLRVDGTTHIRAQEYDGTTADSTSAGSLSAGTWAHVAGTYNGTTNFAYLNGTQATGAGARTAPSGVDTTYLARLDSGAYWDGDLAEVAVWNVALDAAEIAALAANVSPLLVRPTAIVAYWPLIGQYSPEIDVRARNELTLNNTPVAAAHCRILYPAGPQWKEGVRIAVTFEGAATLTFTPAAALRAGAALSAAAALTWTPAAALRTGVGFAGTAPLTWTPTADLRIFAPRVSIMIAGTERATGRVDESKRVLVDSLQVTDVIEATPTQCALSTSGFISSAGDEVIVALGTTRIFAGPTLLLDQAYVGSPSNPVGEVRAIDYTWGLNKRKVTGRYTSTTVGVIATNLIATYASEYTIDVAADAADIAIDEITYSHVDLIDALTRLTKRAGVHWKCTFYRVVRVFLVDTDGSDPTPLTSSHPSLTDFVVTRDLGQVVTRTCVEGGGVNAIAEVAVGETILPLDSTVWYESAGGVVVSGPQRITYTGVQVGGGGTLVGPGVSPSSAPGAAAIDGAGVESGVHLYAVTFVTASGESLPSPTRSVTTGVLAAPASAPTVGTPTDGGSVTDGAHTYATTFVTASGETTAGTSSASVTTGPTTLPAPTSWSFLSNNNSGGSLSSNSYYAYAVTFVTASGETTAYRITNPAFASSLNHTLQILGVPTSSHSAVTARKIYRTTGQGSSANALTAALKLVATIGDNSTTSYNDTTADGSLGAAPPSSTTATYGTNTVPVSAIPTGGADVTSRKLYRTAAGASQLKLLTTLADNTTTTYSDTTADGSLGANIPTSNTTAENRVSLTGIPIGAASVTSRKVYRTVAGGSQLKLQSTIANNTATTLTDSTADASLGANVPTGDTSGLAQPAGQVVSGSTTLLVAGTANFASTGGWAIIGNGQQVIRYTGFTGSSLSGIPASGNGAIVATVAYNSTITAAPALTGIATSGAGSVLYTIKKGDPVNLLVQVDDIAAQTALAALIGGDGIQEDYVQDGHISHTEAQARGTALLELRTIAAGVGIHYKCRDPLTAAGKTISVDLPTPTNVTGDFTIQQVTISDFQPAQFPLYEVHAAATRFSLEDLLRLARQASN